MWESILGGLTIGALGCGMFWLGALVQRQMPFLVRQKEQKDTATWEQPIPKRGWGPATRGHANPMGPPPKPPEQMRQKMTAEMPEGFPGES